jgi:hypothetical protein
MAYIITENTTNLATVTVTNLPEKGIMTNCPTGSANKILPKSASKCQRHLSEDSLPKWQNTDPLQSKREEAVFY